MGAGASTTKNEIIRSNRIHIEPDIDIDSSKVNDENKKVVIQNISKNNAKETTKTGKPPKIKDEKKKSGVPYEKVNIAKAISNKANNTKTVNATTVATVTTTTTTTNIKTTTRKKKGAIEIDSPDVTPRLSNYDGKFVMQSIANSHSENPQSDSHNDKEVGLFLSCNSKGTLEGSDYSFVYDSTKIYSSCEWKVVYLDMKWPQHYFHLFNNTQRRLVRAELIESTDQENAFSSSSSRQPHKHNYPQGKITTITVADSEKRPELRDTKLLFYLSRSKSNVDHYIINCTFGMCLSHGRDNKVELVPVPEGEDDEKPELLWTFLSCK